MRLFFDVKKKLSPFFLVEKGRKQKVFFTQKSGG